jgi:hypothetical protein
LSDEEHVFLTAAAQGDVPIIRQSLEAALQSQQTTDEADDAAAAVTKTTSGVAGDDGDDGCVDSRRQYRKRKSVSGMSTSGPSSRLNIDCVDYMGRSALHLAVDRLPLRI